MDYGRLMRAAEAEQWGQIQQLSEQLAKGAAKLSELPSGVVEQLERFEQMVGNE